MTSSLSRKVFGMSAAAIAVMLLAAAPSFGGVVFTEDFQDPDITGYDQGTRPSSWIDAGSGYGANRHGLIDVDSGAFTDAVGEQAYAFRYTSSPRIETAASVIGTVQAGFTYTLSFDVQEDLGDNEGSAVGYNAEIFAFDGTNKTVLVSETSSVAAGPNWTTITLDVTIDPVDDAALVGQDLRLGFQDLWTGSGGISSGVIDDVSLAAIPEPASLALVGLGTLLIAGRRRGTA